MLCIHYFFIKRKKLFGRPNTTKNFPFDFLAENKIGVRYLLNSSYSACRHFVKKHIEKKSFLFLSSGSGISREHKVDLPFPANIEAIAVIFP